jgi:N-acetylmuramoyl-L-alanine amidase
MNRIAMSSAHSQLVRGAKGFLDEVNESRRVVPAVANALRGMGVTVETFNDNISKTQAANLSAITGWHSSQRVDLHVSVHFNAFQTTQAARGTETLYKASARLADARRVSAAIARAGSFIDRGAKHRTNLSFLNRLTHSLLLEICFVDSRADADLYNRNFDGICIAIAEGLTGRSASVRAPTTAAPSVPGNPILRNGATGEAVRELQQLLNTRLGAPLLTIDGSFGPITEGRVRAFQTARNLTVDGVVGPITWGALRS